MENPNENPTASPQGGQGAGAPQNTESNPAPSANPTGDGNGQGTKVTVDLEEFNRLKRDAGRWGATQTQKREERNRQRPRNNPPAGEDLDEETQQQIAERDRTINDLQSRILSYEAKDKVSEILGRDEYKDIPENIKRAIARNPFGFANPNSKTLEDVAFDIEDYLEDELKSIAPKPAPAAADGADANRGNNQTPPANNPGPSSSGFNPREGIGEKRGQAASMHVLENLFKNVKK